MPVQTTADKEIKSRKILVKDIFSNTRFRIPEHRHPSGSD